MAPLFAMFEKLQMSMSKLFSASISHNFSFFMIIFHLLFIHLSRKLNKVIVFGCGIEASSTEAKGTVLLKGDEYVLAVTDTITVTVCYTIIVTITAIINVTISVSITVTISVTIVVTICDCREMDSTSNAAQQTARLYRIPCILKGN